MGKATILIVEDNGILAANLQSTLTSLGYGVLDPVATGEEAILVEAARQPDLVLMDIKLAGEMNGITAAGHIGAVSDVPIIFLTGYSEDTLLQQAKATAPYGYMIKPVSERELAATIEMALHRHSLDRRLKVSEAKLRKSEELLQLVIRGTHAGIWDWNVQTGETIFNERWAEIVGYTLEELEPVSIKTWLDLCYPDDVKASDELLRKHFAGEVEFYDFEGRKKHKDGYWVWVNDRGQVVERDAAGNPLRMTGTSVEISERKWAEEELLESEQGVRRMNEHILNMVMALSHDIRGPSVAIASILKLLLRGVYGKLDQSPANTVKDLLSRCARLLGTAEDYLGKASIIGSSIKMGREVLDLRQDIIDAVLEELADDITRHEIVIDNRLGAIPAGSISISANKTWLKAVYRNLFSNAIKYGGKGCTISFGFEQDESHYRLNVYNSGRPIAEEDREKIFTRFERVGPPEGPTHDGVGLGLSLCREIILDHGGEIWYEARPDGSNFVFTLSRNNSGEAQTTRD